MESSGLPMSEKLLKYVAIATMIIPGCARGNYTESRMCLALTFKTCGVIFPRDRNVDINNA
ncbi:MAG: hypothetical protein GWP10_03185 [Nitrospiraceae bacterium]|nr:hypothetical protein [Nitrospiraceae bacterium]